MNNAQKREAIIYVPGLTQRGDKDKSLESFSYRIKKAIDINYPEGSYKFGLEIQKKSFGKDNKLECKMAAIFRFEGQEKVPVCDIYEMDYTPELTGKFEKQNVFIKTIWLFNAIVSKFPRLLWVILHSGIKGIPLKDKVQTFIVSFILFCLSIYGITLVSALVAAIGSRLNFGSFPGLSEVIVVPDLELPYFIHLIWEYITVFLHWTYTILASVVLTIVHLINGYKKYILSSAAVVLLFLPDLKNFITSTATDYLCLINYFNIGDRRLTIIGKFEELLEHISEQDVAYSKVSVYSYSFGSIVALDTLFPYDGRCSERTRKEVKTLVTIGCPFDFIRVYWPNYYCNRKQSNVELHSWYNIHSGLDVLSSNFRNDELEEEAAVRIAEGSLLPHNISYNVIPPENVGFTDMILLLGLRAHTMYWDDSEYSASCFTNLFQEMKRNELSILRGSQQVGMDLKKIV